MAIQQIQYDDKEAINIDSAVPDKNKCKADDLNEIKSVVNNNSYETPKVSSQVDTNYKVNVLTTKNLFDKDTMILNAFINQSNLQLASSNDFRTIYIPCKPNTIYTIQKIQSNRFVWGFTSDDNLTIPKILSGVGGENTETQKTITSTNDAKYMFVMVSKITDDTTNINDLLNSIQIEEGSTATTYEAFIPNTINVNNEKYTDTINVGTFINDKNRINVLYSHNLFNKDNINKLNAYFESSGGTIIANDYNRVLYIPCTPNTDYTFTQGTSSLSNHIFQVATTNTKPEINTIVYDFTDKTNYSTFTYTTNATAKYLVIRIRGGDDVDTFYNGVQIEKGSTATTYEPYITPSINVDGEEIYKYNPMRTIWTGAKHAYNDVLDLKEQLEIGALYLVEMMAFSSSYRYCQEFIYLGYADILQINYSSFPDDLYVRYRIEATNSSQLRIKDVQGTAGTNTDITHIYRIK